MDDFLNYKAKQPAAEGEMAQTDWEKEAKKLASKYNGKNENELIRDIFARAAEGKKNGTLTNEQIDAFYCQFAPMLDGAKKKKLQKLISQLKSI